MRLLSTRLTGAVAVVMLSGSPSLTLAQGEDQDRRHFDDAATVTAQVQDQPDPTPMPQPGPGMMRMSPEMMQQMQDRMTGGQAERMEPGMMPRGGMMGSGMMGSGMMDAMMRTMFALMDADGDGTLSREEFAEAHDRIFNHMDADGDGQLTLEETRASRMGAAGPAAPVDAPDAEADE
jgi:hypothetical protein